jgi:predicted dehydrogenase
MAERQRIGVVGLGWVGTARHLPAIVANPQFQLVGVADRNAERPIAIADKYRVRGSVASNLAQIDWIDDVDAISIATAPMAHHALVCEGLARGLHVITEKPFAMNVGEGREMLEAARNADRRLAVVHNFQFARSMQRLRADLETGRLGKIRGLRAIQLGNPSRRLPTWYEELPLGLFYDESPHLLYLLASIAGPLNLAKAVSADSRHGNATPAQIDCWFDAEGADYPISMSCNFEASLSEWHVSVHGEHAVGIVDVFRDIYLRLPNDGAHDTRAVLTTSIAASAQHWWQHVSSGVPHLMGRLRYGNDEVFGRFSRAIAGDTEALAPIAADAALRTLTLQHSIIEQRERLYR